MIELEHNKKIKMLYIQEIKGISQYGNNYHFIKLLKIGQNTKSNKIEGKCFDCLPYYSNTNKFECGDIVEVIFDNHWNKKNPQIHDIEKTGENIFKSSKLL